MTRPALDAMAYDHASHGCPFEEEGECPVCDTTRTPLQRTMDALYAKSQSVPDPDIPEKIREQQRILTVED